MSECEWESNKIKRICLMVIPGLCLVFVALVFFLDRPSHSASSPLDSDTISKSNMSANSNPLTSHVLNTAIGRPAEGVQVTLFRQGLGHEQWIKVADQLTNSDGRIGNIISGAEFTRGVYKLHFDTRSYYEARAEKTFYPYIEVVFEIERPEEHFHVPILLSAYGFSTYRGS